MDVISRQAAIDAPFKKFDMATGVTWIPLEYIEKLPSAQPEIIRCKDCKHFIEHKWYGNLGESAYTCEGNMMGWIYPDSYCSKAERKENR